MYASPDASIGGNDRREYLRRLWWGCLWHWLYFTDATAASSWSMGAPVGAIPCSTRPVTWTLFTGPRKRTRLQPLLPAETRPRRTSSVPGTANPGSGIVVPGLDDRFVRLASEKPPRVAAVGHGFASQEEDEHTRTVSRLKRSSPTVVHHISTPSPSVWLRSRAKSRR